MPTTNPTTFNELVLAEINKKSAKTLSKHVDSLIDKAAYAVNRVFVNKDSSVDLPEDKVNAMVDMLRNAADLLADVDNPSEFKFAVDEGGDYTGGVMWKIKESEYTRVIPGAMLERSELNRIRRAAKDITS